MSPRHLKCWEALPTLSIEGPPSVGDGGYLAIIGVWMRWVVYIKVYGKLYFFSEEWQEREALALALDTILLATRCIPQVWKFFIFFRLKMFKNCWAIV